MTEKRPLVPVSVVVPARNEEASIGETICALARQTWRPAEVVVVDAGSTDKTAEVVRRVAAEAGLLVRILMPGAALPGRARNVGAKDTHHPVLAFLDAGTTPRPDWLEKLIEPLLDDASIDIVFGSYEPGLDTPFHRACALVWVNHRRNQDNAPIRARSVASMAMTRDVWDRVGGFPEHLRAAEDGVFVRAALRTARRVVLAPSATVEWHMPDTVGQVYTKFHAYSRCALEAGFAGDWHRPVLTRYIGVVLAGAVAGILLYSVAVPLAIVGLLPVVRTIVNACRKRGYLPPGASGLRVLGAAVILTSVVDAAALSGAVAWLREGCPRLPPPGVG